MRYYSLSITDQSSGKAWTPQGLGGIMPRGISATSFLSGANLSGALNVEVDAPVTSLANPAGDVGAWIRIWGVSLQDISQAKNLYGYNVSLTAGMQKGLPLANPSQIGVLFRGFINQAYGNWIGTDQTLEMLIVAGPSPTRNPIPKLVHVWKKGTHLSDAISHTLSIAFPSYKLHINISPDLVLSQDDAGVYDTVYEYAQYIKEASLVAVNKTGYQGVDIIINQNAFIVTDGTTQKTPRVIAFQDLIGQPTWIESPNVQFKTVMRGDLSIDDYVQLPSVSQAQYTTTQPAYTQTQNIVKNRSAFQGNFRIISVHHFGNFRQPDAASWATVYEAAPVAVS